MANNNTETNYISCNVTSPKDFKNKTFQAKPPVAKQSLI